MGFINDVTGLFVALHSVIVKAQKGEFQICRRMDLDNILYVEYLRYNNYKNEIILILERC